MTNEMPQAGQLLEQADASLKKMKSRPMPDIYSFNQQQTEWLLGMRNNFTEPLLELLDVPVEKLPGKVSHRELLDKKGLSVPAAKTVLEMMVLLDLDSSLSGLDLDWKSQASSLLEDCCLRKTGIKLKPGEKRSERRNWSLRN